MITVNGLPAISLRWISGWSGVWVLEVEYSAEVSLPTSGPAVVLTTEGDTFVGTIDGELSSTFGEKRHLRILGGRAGWSKSVRAQQYHSDVGVNLAVVASTTAAEVGEIATVLLPLILGEDFVRRKGPASQIFADAGVDWWVGLDGVTRIGRRIPTPQGPSLQIVDWDPITATASFTSDTVVEPGTIVVDLRFGGARIVRQVEATIESASVKGTLWLAEEVADAGAYDELIDGLGAIARAATRIEFARFYEYRVIAMQGDRVILQATKPADGMPDLIPVSVWAGVSGYRAQLAPASRVLVGFRAGDARRPYVAFYEPPEADGWRPVELELDAVGGIVIGARALGVVIGDVGTARPIARVTESFATWITAVTAAINGLVGPGTVTAPIDVGSTKGMAS